jgi:hypothetical protein
VGDLLTNLAARAVGATSGLRPRVASRFEPRAPRDTVRLAEAVIQSRIRFRGEDPEPEGGWTSRDRISAETANPTAGAGPEDRRTLRPSPPELGTIPGSAATAAREPPRRSPILGGEARAPAPAPTPRVAARPLASGVRAPATAAADSPATPRPTLAPPPNRPRGVAGSIDPAPERGSSSRRSNAGPPRTPGGVAAHPEGTRADPAPALTTESRRSAPPSRRDGLRAQPPVQTVVQVTIGRIELRPSASAASPEGSPTRTQRPRPDGVTLDDYLARRSGVAS